MTDITLPAAPAPDILRRLVFARQFLEHAKAHMAGGTDLDFMIATHGADNAIEFLLKLIADHVRYEEVSGRALPETQLAKIVGELAKFLREKHGLTLPYIQEIKALRQVRNLVQHGSFTPGADIERQLTIAERFFARACTCFFGIESNEMRIGSIMSTPV